MASFAIALFYFALEVGVYKTVEPRAAISPGVIASESVGRACHARSGFGQPAGSSSGISIYFISFTLLSLSFIPLPQPALSLVLMFAGYSSIVSDGAAGKKKK